MSTTIIQLARIQKVSIAQEMCDEKLKQTMAQVVRDGPANEEVDQAVSNLENAVQEYRTQVTKYVKQYRESQYWIDRQASVLSSIRLVLNNIRNTLESHHYTEESEDMLDTMQKFLTTMNKESEIGLHQGKADQAIQMLSTLTKSCTGFSNIFDVPVCPICMENKCDRYLRCGHMYCAGCVNDLRLQSNGRCSTVVICGLCRNSTEIGRVSPLHYP